VILLGAVLAFTLPAFDRQGCGAGPSRIVADSLDWTLYARVQSPAWIAMSPAMLADPSVYNALWPVCRSEAEPFVVARGRGIPGARVTVTPPLVLAPVKWFSVTSTNAAGESCQSNVVEGK